MRLIRSDFSRNWTELYPRQDVIVKEKKNFITAVMGEDF